MASKSLCTLESIARGIMVGALICHSIGSFGQVDSTTMASINSKLSILTSQGEKNYIGQLRLSQQRVSVYDYRDYILRDEISRNAIKAARKISKGISKGRSNRDEVDSLLMFTKSDFVLSTVGDLEVDSVEMSIVEGVVDNVRVNASGKIFTNRGRPISLIYYDREEKMLFSSDMTYFILLGEIVQYFPRVDQHYVPDDAAIVLSDSSKVGRLRASVDLNSSVELRIFSDLLGLFGEQGNGLVQTELSSKIFANTVPQSTVIGPFYWGNFVEPYFRYSKFDSKFSEVIIEDTTSRYSITDKEQLFMNQQSFINLGIRVNYGKIRVSNTFLELNFGLEYNYVKVRPTNETEVSAANLGSFDLEMRGGILRSKNFGLTYSLAWILQTVQSTTFETEGGSTRRYLKPMFELFFHPNADPASKVFVRFLTFVDFDSNLSYANLQFGYSAKLGMVKK